MKKLLLVLSAVLLPCVAVILALFGRLDADVATWLAREPPGYYNGKVSGSQITPEDTAVS